MIQKSGVCGLCKGSKPKPVTGKFYFDSEGNITTDKHKAETLQSFGLCQSHYWEQNNKKNLKKNKTSEKGKDKIEFKKDLNVFFASQLLEIPDKCENCPNSIVYFRANKNMWRSLIAHILPKRLNYGFPVVATHPQNKIFLCPECHGNYDNLGSDFAKKMPALPLMRERFNTFKHLLSESELQRVPEYLK